MAKIRRYLIMAGIASCLFSADAAAMIPASPTQLLCRAPYIVVGTVQSASKSIPACSTETCDERASLYPQGLALVTVDKVLSGDEFPVPGIVPGKQLFLQIDWVISDRYRRKWEAHGSDTRDLHPGITTSSPVEGRRFVFLVSSDSTERGPSDGTAEKTVNEKIPYEASVWRDGEADERMVYAVAGNDADRHTGYYNSCEKRYDDPCLTGNEGKSVADIYATITSPDASRFALQCAANAFGTKGEAAVGPLIKLLASSDVALQGVAQHAIRAIGPAAGATLASLMGIIRTDIPGTKSQHSEAYAAIGALGEKAKPAIPELLAMLRADRHNSSLLGALKALARHDPEVIIPRFFELFSDASFRQDFFFYDPQWLDKSAKVAFPYLVKQVQMDVAHEEYAHLKGLTGAMAAVEEVDKSVPALVAMLNNPHTAEFAALALGSLGTQADRAIPALLSGLNNKAIPAKGKVAFAGALVNIGVTSALVRDYLITELIEHDDVSVAEPLSKIDPLPKSLGPDLKRVLNRLTTRDGLSAKTLPAVRTDFLCIALENTQSGEWDSECDRWSPPRVYRQPVLDPAACKAPPETVRGAPRILNYCACRPASYPKASARNGETGTLEVSMDIGADNELIDIKIKKTSGFRDLDNPIVNAMKLCQFKAGMVDGKPVRSLLQKKFIWGMDHYEYHHKVTLDVE